MTFRTTQLVLKRVMDVGASATLLVLLLPVLACVYLLIRWNMGGPALFVQPRPGLRGKIFSLFKFRTMTQETADDGILKSDAERLTPLGRFLRRSSLDELPQLWNVLRGDMSLVGPRPLLTDYLPRYTPEQARRHDVTPGITGWAQVHGRQGVLFSKRLELDVWYVENWSVGLDLKILLMTAGRVFTAHGVKPGQDVGEVDDLGLSRPAPVTNEATRRKAA